MISSFKNGNHKIDLSAYLVDLRSETIDSAIERFGRGKLVMLVDGDVVFANTQDSATYRLRDDRPEKGFSKYHEGIHRTLFWDEKSYSSALKYLRSSPSDFIGEVVLKDWSVVGIYINPKFF